MHAEAYRWIADSLAKLARPSRVIEFGSRDINGSPRPLLNGTRYIGVDRLHGPGVDVVIDAARYVPSEPADILICAEVLEHAENAEDIVWNAVNCLAPGGHLIVTCATDHRAPHSCVDGGPLRQGEFYRNVPPEELAAWIELSGATLLEQSVHPTRGDLYVLAEVPV